MNGEVPAHKIEEYAFGSIRIGGRSYGSDVVIYRDSIEEWWRGEGHLLQPADLDEILARQPDAVIIGTGYHGAMRISPAVHKLCRERGVRLIARCTAEAVGIFNRFLEEGGSSVVAAFHLTC